MELLEKFKAYIQKENLFQPKDRLLLAVSGGVDSVVLCELCKKGGYDFVMAHCNFQLRGADSLRDQEFVAALSVKYGVPFLLKTFDTIAYATTAKKSVEEAARDLRYEWFHSFVANKKPTTVAGKSSMVQSPQVNYILTAHHADDNIETVLMNFFRGTGITGLKGILPKHDQLVRPLLFARRSELEAYINDQQLPFVTDYTNFSNDYTRNYYRNTIIPLISERYPNATTNVLKNIRRFRETEDLYKQAVQLHKKKLLEPKGSEVHIPVLKLLKTEPLTTVLYEIIKDYGFTSHQTDEAVALLKSETGKYIQSATHRIIRNRNWLIISPCQSEDAQHILIEEADKIIPFKHGRIKIEKQSILHINQSALVAQLDAAAINFPLILRKWKQGDYFYPLGMQKKKKLNRFLIDQKCSLTQKENTWVIEMDKKIIWVVGMRIDDRFKIKENTSQTYTLCLLGGSGNQADHSL